MSFSGLIVAYQNSLTAVRDRFPTGKVTNLLFNSDILNFLLKTNRRVTERLAFFSFIVWSALIVVGWWLRVEEGLA